MTKEGKVTDGNAGKEKEMTDYSNMSLREELETRFADAERRKQEEEMLSRGWQPPAERGEAAGFQRKQTKKSDKAFLTGISDQVSGAVGDMISNYVNMREDNTIGNDDYFHCKANYEAADRGILGGIVAEKLGNAKEIFDVYRNVSDKGLSAWSAIKDYFHDTGINNKGRQLARKKIYSSSKNACDLYRVKGINDRY